MESIRRTLRTPFVRASLVVGVIACLCFSAGEGLRLTPLPVFPLEEVRSSGLRVDAALSRGTAQHLTGPLDLPAQGRVQKRSKRQTLECECPPPSDIGEIPFHPLRYSSAGDRIARASCFPDAHPPGRAPPVIS
ncbi:MAG TPA: hypothetical protein VEX60_09200 [Pyrinomonadaceae bacterium]|nr:hypothetical protein [Pyrinomonadaceae bacterium]